MLERLERHLTTAFIAVVLVNAGILFAVYVWSVAACNEFVALLSGLALVVVIVLGCFLTLVPDEAPNQGTERMLSMASGTFAQMRVGLNTDTCQETCELVLPETNAMAVAMTDRHQVLGYAGELADEFPPGSQIHTKETLAVLDGGEMQIFSSLHPADDSNDAVVAPAGIIVPLVIQDRPVGTIKFYYHDPTGIDRSQIAIARGMGQLLSSQLNAFALDRQAELMALAEVKALQAQINPHFLFNTLNTISALTRVDPDRARELLREFSVFYRQTLENSETSVPLSRELEQTERYLKFEIARFGEDRIIVRTHIDSELEGLPVPSFMVQPIVENAVRHAMRDEGALHIDISAAVEGDDVLIAVVDDGVGMTQETAAGLLSGNTTPSETAGVAKRQADGTGIALRNVADRVERFYGEGSGVEITSHPGEGTTVLLRLCDAAIGLERE